MEAETILLHNKNFEEAVEMFLRLHQWERALDLAQQHKLDVETILDKRKKYLAVLGKDEFSVKFLKLNI